VDVLPSLRRTFGGWPRAARRQVATAVSELGRPRDSAGPELEDFSAASDVLATVALILNPTQPPVEPGSPEESARNEPTSRRVETPHEGNSDA
jgi:hypothetical protein